MNQENNIPVVLIIHPGTLGDVVLSLSAIQDIRRRFQFHELVLLVRGEIGEMLVEYGVVDRVLDIDGTLLGELFGESPQFVPGVSDVLSRCRYAVAWVNDLEGRLSVNLKSLGVEECCILSPHDKSLFSRHQSDRYCEIVGIFEGPAGEPIPSPSFQFELDAKRFKVIHSGFLSEDHQKVVMIHPGSGSRHKCLRPEILGVTMRQLTEEQDHKLIICQGPSDEEFVFGLQPYLNSVPHEILKNTDLSNMAKALRQADVFVGHDSGLTHLAVALGVPTIALFGPTDSQRWGPKGKNVEILHGSFCQCQDWNAVQHCADKTCLNHSVEDIVQAVERMLARSHDIANFEGMVKVH